MTDLRELTLLILVNPRLEFQFAVYPGHHDDETCARVLHRAGIDDVIVWQTGAMYVQNALKYEEIEYEDGQGRFFMVKPEGTIATLVKVVRRGDV